MLDLLPEIHNNRSHKMPGKKILLVIFFAALSSYLHAQLCQGSLGDPVVNITFGSGFGFGGALKQSVTNYNYVSRDCPDDGNYTITNSTSNCFGNTWHTVSEDHTAGDNNGFMMVVNASFNPGDFYLDTVKGLCSGTTYEFASWLLNVLSPQACAGNGISPNITFKIESTTGTILQSYSTGNINLSASPVWKQYGLFFTTPAATTSVVLRMTNNAPGGCGNDILLDDITFRPCGPKVSVSINGSPDKKSVCTDDTSSVLFTSTIVGAYTNPVYQWQKSNDGNTWTDIIGENDTSYSIPAISTPGNYYFRLAVAQGGNISLPSCRVASDPAVLTVDPLPIPGASNNSPVCEDKSLSLDASNGSNYAWTGPNNFVSDVQSPVIPNAALSNAGKYYVKVTTAIGCVNVDSTVVVVNKNPLVNAGADVNICSGTSTTLQGATSNSVSWSWSPPQGLSDPSSLKPLAMPGVTTTYKLTVSNGVCSNADSVLVSVVTSPSANAGPDKVIVGYQVATLDGQATGLNVSYFWTPDLFLFPDSSLTPTVSPTFDTAYILHVISNDGCGTSTDTVRVKYFKEIYIPNAFTPNNDGINDTWKIPALQAFPLSEIRVYNRYGQLVFYNKGYTKQWDGTFKGAIQPAGIYSYTIDIKNGMKLLYGVLSVLR